MPSSQATLWPTDGNIFIQNQCLKTYKFYLIGSFPELCKNVSRVHNFPCKGNKYKSGRDIGKSTKLLCLFIDREWGGERTVSISTWQFRCNRPPWKKVKRLHYIKTTGNDMFEKYWKKLLLLFVFFRKNCCYELVEPQCQLQFITLWTNSFPVEWVHRTPGLESQRRASRNKFLNP